MYMQVKFRNLPVDIFKEGEYYIAVCQPLDISGYGKTIDEAKESWKIVFEMTMEYLVEEGTLIEDLKSHGFEINDGEAEGPDLRFIGQEKLNMELSHA